MDAGRLARRITIEEIGPEVDDGLRTKPGGWLTLCSRAAELMPLSGSERLAAGEQAAFTSLKFQLRRPRSLRPITTLDRLVFQGRIHNIIAVNPIGRAELEIICTARADADPDTERVPGGDA